MTYNREAAWDHAEREYPDATHEQLKAIVRAGKAMYDAHMAAAGLGEDDDYDGPGDTPTVANCDDWGTGEGRYHGRM